MQKSILFKLLRGLSLLPFLAWPMVFNRSVFIFDNPNAIITAQYIILFAIILYPLYLIANAIISNMLYYNAKICSILINLLTTGIARFYCIAGFVYRILSLKAIMY